MPLDKKILSKANTVLKKFGDGLAVTRLSDNTVESEVKLFLPTGILTLDVILGGGWPIGRVIEVSGHESSGKSMIGALACVQALAYDVLPVYMDVEFAVDPTFFTNVGLSLDDVYYTSPETIGQIFGTIEGMIEFKKQQYGKDHPMILVWDSVAAATNKEEAARKWEDKGYSTSAIYISQAFRKLKGVFGPNNTSLLMVNQLRDNVGVLFGPSTKTYGGWAPRYYASIRLALSETGKKQSKVKGRRFNPITGVEYKAVCIKNKITSPFRQCILPYNFNTYSIDERTSVLGMLKDLGLTTYGGGFYKCVLPEIGEITFKKADIPELLAEYRQPLYQLLNAAWTGNNSDLVGDEDE